MTSDETLRSRGTSKAFRLVTRFSSLVTLVAAEQESSAPTSPTLSVQIEEFPLPCLRLSVIGPHAYIGNNSAHVFLYHSLLQRRFRHVFWRSSTLGWGLNQLPQIRHGRLRIASSQISKGDRSQGFMGSEVHHYASEVVPS